MNSWYIHRAFLWIKDVKWFNLSSVAYNLCVNTYIKINLLTFENEKLLVGASIVVHEHTPTIFRVQNWHDTINSIKPIANISIRQTFLDSANISLWNMKIIQSQHCQNRFPAKGAKFFPIIKRSSNNFKKIGFWI